MTIKFIHTADIHLDSPLKGLEVHDDAPVDEIRGATRRAFDRLIGLALDEAVDFVLIAGDLYDGDWKDYNTGLFFANRMGQLARAGIRVFIVSGNHDAASQITRAMPLPDNVTLFPKQKPKSVMLDDLGVVIHGQSYSTPAVTDNLSAGYPFKISGSFNIGLLHTSLTGRGGHENYAPCTLDDLKSKGYDYWALGHVHKREVMPGEPWIVFPGNLQGRHIRETGAKGATLVTVEDGKVVTVEARELDVLRWAFCQVDLCDCDTMDQVYETVRRAIEQEMAQSDAITLALRLVLTGKTLVHARLHEQKARWTEEFRGIATAFGSVWLEKVNFTTSRRRGLDQCVGRNSPIGGLLDSIQSLNLDQESLDALVPDLRILKNKLPPEVHLDDQPFLDLSPDKIKLMLAEVQELLIAKLLKHGEKK